MCDQFKKDIIPLLRARDRLRFEVDSHNELIKHKDPSDKLYGYFANQLQSYTSQLRVVNKSIDLMLEDLVGVDALRQERIYPNATQYHKGNVE